MAGLSVTWHLLLDDEQRGGRCTEHTQPIVTRGATATSRVRAPHIASIDKLATICGFWQCNAGNTDSRSQKVPHMFGGFKHIIVNTEL